MRRRRKKNPWNAVLLLLFIGIGGFALWKLVFWSLQTESFAVKQVNIKGLRYQDKTSVSTIINSALGQNIFRVGLDSLEMRVERLPWIKKARLYRSFPAHLNLVVEERSLIAALNRGGRLIGVDCDGNTTAELRPGEVFDLPIISKLRSGEKEMKQAVDFLTAAYTLSPAIYSRISEVTMYQGKLAVLMGENAQLIIIGAGQYANKLIKLWALLEKSDWKPGAYSIIDLRFSRQVILKKDGNS
ncbi:FtsQ-type POTRA domain-containing protein [bacterium]|nr:FtsQ-type POTRA domain-containing protein [FCB group bacterium]MBL7190111.1 FtsQ-type POTRA domain-containing protein [bacterium]